MDWLGGEMWTTRCVLVVGQSSSSRLFHDGSSLTALEQFRVLGHIVVHLVGHLVARRRWPLCWASCWGSFGHLLGPTVGTDTPVHAAQNSDRTYHLTPAPVGGAHWLT